MKVSQLLDSYDYIFKGRVTAISIRDPDNPQRFYNGKCWVTYDTTGEGTHWYKPLNRESKIVILAYESNAYSFYDSQSLAESNSPPTCPYAVGEEYLVFGSAYPNDNFVHEGAYSLSRSTRHGSGLLGALLNQWANNKLNHQ